jgi:hypothetical protein
MKVIVRPTTGPDDWRQFLAEPEKQWKPGYSAHLLAHCWEHADGLPESVRTVFETDPRYREFEPHSCPGQPVFHGFRRVALASMGAVRCFESRLAIATIVTIGGSPHSPGRTLASMQ